MELIVPAVLPSSHDDFIEKVNRFAQIPTVTRIQIDVVDGRFASPVSWPYTDLQELRSLVSENTMLPSLERVSYEIDLICLDADRSAGAWLMLGASRLTFHAESIVQIGKFLASMKERYGDVASFGLAINVTSSLALVESCLDQVDYLQFMGISSIGKQGQPFDRRVLELIRVFRSRHPEVPLQVDGGVTLQTARELVELGVTNLVVGSALERAPDIALEIGKFETLVSPFGI
jgi:ribulose-phosphate 3-epimerase